MSNHESSHSSEASEVKAQITPGEAALLVKSSESLVSANFDLLPLEFREKRVARRLVNLWSVLILALAITLTGLVVKSWSGGIDLRINNQELIAASQPIALTSKTVKVIESDIKRRGVWLDWIESARPTDCLLQTIAAVTKGTHPIKNAEARDHIQIESLVVKLPLEYPAKTTQPTWAKPVVQAVAAIEDKSLSQRWVTDLEKSPRLKSIDVKVPSGKWTRASIQMSAHPIVTRIVP